LSSERSGRMTSKEKSSLCCEQSYFLKSTATSFRATIPSIRFRGEIPNQCQDVKPTAPAVFLSGNGPLVQVLQYELRGAGGDGKTFVRGVKEYVRRYSGSRHRIPPEHVLVFDEAQRAFDRDMVAQTHGHTGAKSEPEHFVEFASRIPGWCVVIGLIGSGQEIHVGEEGGLIQWRHAVEGCHSPGDWRVHVPPVVEKEFVGSPVPTETVPSLNLDTEIRFHLAKDLHRFVELLLADGVHSEEARAISEHLLEAGYHLRLTRNDEVARSYLKDRYRENPDARYGLLASSKDKELEPLGIPNDFQSTKRIQPGPWYGESEENPQSCRHLRVASPSSRHKDWNWMPSYSPGELISSGRTGSGPITGHGGTREVPRCGARSNSVPTPIGCC
jgi:hypothetical protein